MKIPLGKRILIFDGAMGTIFIQRGLEPGKLPETLNFTNPQLVREVHEGYLAVGSDFVSANSFGANRYKLCDMDVAETVKRAVSIAREAADKYTTADKPRFVALDVGSTGKLLEPLGTLSFEAAYEAFVEVTRAGAEAGADVIAIETMSDTYEMKAAVLAAKETGLPVFATFTFDSTGKLLTGAPLRAAAALLEGLDVDALGINCSLGPEQTRQLARELRSYTDKPIMIQPNAGMPGRDGKYDVSADDFAVQMSAIAQEGAWIVGGCCGTSPEYIEKTAQLCAGVTPKPLPKHSDTVVTSYSKAVVIGGAPVVIGERINPTGKKRFKEALRDKDIDYIIGEAIAEQDAGAHVLDVNVGLPEIDEADMMAHSIKAIQSVTPLPLQIDTADASVMERALRLYNGKALVNSVNGKQSVMDAIFPLAKKYGGVVIGLTLDEHGIPETAQGRLDIAARIVETAEKYGIKRRDILIDALTLTISSDPMAAKTTLDSIKLVKEKLGVKTVLGVSNVSFGLPMREKLNAAFYTMALQSGLDAAIINPCSEPMMDSYRAFKALSNMDEACADYIASYSKAQTAPETPKEDITLGEAVFKGMAGRAYALANEKLEHMAPLDVIDTELVPALDRVGAHYERGTLFLPQLLMSAQAAQSAFRAVSERMQREGSAQKKKDKVIVATVKGDIHDIGKNIARVMLENYGFEVIDLGKDVPIETVVAAAKEHDVRLVGLSALMTTTVRSMQETIEALHLSGHACRILVGGAVLTQEYADMIHADFYARDAVATVNYAKRVFEE